MRSGRGAGPAYAVLDGTLVPIDRVADQKPYYSGEHHRHGVSVQILAEPAGRLVRVSPALPAGRGWHGAHAVQAQRHQTTAVTRPEAANRAHTRIRALGDRAVSLLKGRKAPARPRCCPRRATAIIAAILVLHHIATRRQPR